MTSTSLVHAAALGALLGAMGCKDKAQAPTAEPGTALATPKPDPAKACCRGKNDCKGKGGCAVPGKHDCAGKNDCKTQGGCDMHCPK